MYCGIPEITVKERKKLYAMDARILRELFVLCACMYARVRSYLAIDASRINSALRQ